MKISKEQSAIIVQSLTEESKRHRKYLDECIFVTKQIQNPNLAELAKINIQAVQKQLQKVTDIIHMFTNEKIVKE